MSIGSGLQGYLEEAASWDADRVATGGPVGGGGLARGVAGWLCAIASSAALMLLMPLKRVEPYVVRVDNTTGVVDVVPLYTGHATLGEAVTRYFLTHYITVCERFDYAMARERLRGVRRIQLRRSATRRFMPGGTEPTRSSPLNVHKDGSSETVRIESVSFFKRGSGAADLAQVRFARIERRGDGAPGTVSHWIASIEYRYGEPPDDPRTRGWNPLGFEVLDLGIEPEVLAPTTGNRRPVSPAEEQA